LIHLLVEQIFGSMFLENKNKNSRLSAQFCALTRSEDLREVVLRRLRRSAHPTLKKGLSRAGQMAVWGFYCI